MITLAQILARTRLEPRTGCRLWAGPVHSQGFGALSVDGRKLLAHREACRRAHGEPPSPRHEACHSDACTSLGLRGRLCVEPSHLRWGTRAENARDRERVEEQRRGRGRVLGARRA